MASHTKLIGRHLYTHLITVVVGELCQGQVLISATLEVQDLCSQHVLQNLDSPLWLSVRLRMKHYAHPHMCPHSPLETPPKLSREPGIPIRYDETDTPYNCTISRIYNLSNSSNVKVIRTTRKCDDLVSRSTITHTASCPYDVRGKWVTKSIVTCSHFHSATSKAWSSPTGL